MKRKYDLRDQKRHLLSVDSVDSTKDEKVGNLPEVKSNPLVEEEEAKL